MLIFTHKEKKFQLFQKKIITDKILLRYRSTGVIGFTLRLKMTNWEVMKGQIYLNLL